MAQRFKKTTLISVTFAVLALSLGSGCSHHKPADSSQQQDAADVPPPDAGTDAVPQAAVEDRSGQPSSDMPAPPAPSASDEPPAPAIPPTADNAPAPAAPSDQNPPDQNQAADNTAAPTADSGSSTPPALATPPAMADDSGNYTVRPGDTLMKIAFDNYGDLYKWKDIYDANKDHIKDPNAIPPGTVLKMEKSDTPVAIERNGDQYRIKSGDTLGSISKDVYGTPHKWKKLWKNNKQLIHDPNKIYAGFYLYYTRDQQERLGSNEQHGVGENPTSVAAAPPAADRDPASVKPANPGVAPPAINANNLTSGFTPPPQQMLNVPPPAQHSADLNEVVQKAQMEERSQAAAAGAGP